MYKNILIALISVFFLFGCGPKQVSVDEAFKGSEPYGVLMVGAKQVEKKAPKDLKPAPWWLSWLFWGMSAPEAAIEFSTLENGHKKNPVYSVDVQNKYFLLKVIPGTYVVSSIIKRQGSQVYNLRLNKNSIKFYVEPGKINYIGDFYIETTRGYGFAKIKKVDQDKKNSLKELEKYKNIDSSRLQVAKLTPTRFK